MTANPAAPQIRHILAPNPSPMTERGTNTYLVGTGKVAVIDPGPALPAHQTAILSALAAGEQISHILVTHAHRDHSSLAASLAQATGAPILAFGPATSGRSAVMETLAAQGLAGGGEGLDHAFQPHRLLVDGEVVTGDDWTLRAIWTPGHIGGHLCFALGDVIFSGDHVMGWASSLVSPPDGDLTQFMSSCRRLAVEHPRRLLPGHGAPIEDPASRIAWLMDHRTAREAQIIETLRTGPATPGRIAAKIYTDVAPALLPAATRNVFAHLVDLTGRGAVQPTPTLSQSATFSLGEKKFIADPKSV